MTEEEFSKRKFQHSEIIEFHRPRCLDVELRVVECMLLGVDFENGLFRLEPFDKQIYEDKSFHARFEYCERPKKKLKVIT